MAEEEIVSIVGEKGLRELDLLNEKLERAESLIVAFNDAVKKGELKIKGSEKVSELNNQVVEANANLQALTASQANYTEQVNKKVKSEEAAAKIGKLTAAQQRELASDYLILNKALAEARVRYTNYALVLGKTHELSLQAKKDANSLNDALKDLSFATGDYTKNVGNYNGVGSQFNQILRELPNAGISAQTFITSLSNNMSYFVEAIARARTAGQSWGQILGTIGQSAFGLMGIVNLAALAITAFGDKIIKAFSDDAAKAEEGLTKLQKIVKSLKDDVEAFKIPTFASTQDLNLMDKGAAALERQIKLMRARGDSEAEVLAKEQLLAKIQKQNLEDEIKLYNDRQDSFIRFDKEIYELKQKQAEIDSDIATKTAAYEKSITDKRLKDAKKFAEERLKIEQALQKAIADFGAKLRNGYEGEDDATVKDIGSRNADGFLINAVIKVNTEASKQALIDAESELNATLIGIENSYQQGLYKSVYDYEQAKTDAINEGAKKSFDIEKKYLEAILQYLPIEGKQRRSIQAQINALELAEFKKLNDDKAATEKKTNEERLRLEKQLSDRKKALYRDVVAAAREVGDAILAGEYRRIEQQETNNDVIYATERARIEQSLATEEEKKIQLALLDRREVEQQARLQREKDELQRRSFLLEKAAALGQVAITTATAVAQVTAQAAALAANPVTALLAPQALAQLPLIYGSGALAAGTIAAQILAYAKGTDNHPGGLALYGEAGGELVHEPGRKPYWVDQPTLSALPKGTRVIPEKKLFSMPYIAGVNGMPVEKQQQWSDKGIIGAIKQNKPSVHVHVHNHTNDLYNQVRSR